METKKTHSISIVVPALNEETNIDEAVATMVASCRDAGVDWEILLIDDGSTDRTGTIADELAHRYSPDLKVLHHSHPMGIGNSIRDGVMAATKEAVTWLPGDNENDPSEIIKYIGLLNHVDMIIPFVVNKDVRSTARQFLSKFFLHIVNTSFGTSFRYTNGNVIYKRHIFERIKQESNGFFFQTECLVKASRAGFTFTEVPILIRGRSKGSSKALTWKSLKALMGEYISLFLQIRIYRQHNHTPKRT